MKSIRRIGKRRRPVTSRLSEMEMGMNHHLRAAARGPADRLRIAPTLMADRDPERQRASVEKLAARASHVSALLGGIHLHLVLEAGDRPIAIDDERGDQQS